VAIILGIVFLVEAYDLRARSSDSEELSVIKPMRLFHLSNAYLALLFVAAAADPFVR
jgi:protoheme IX farnesyltransferase